MATHHMESVFYRLFIVVFAIVLRAMKFSTVVEQVLELLQRQKRISYRALKRELDLDDEYIEDLKTELITAKRLARDEDGIVLVWTGEETRGETEKGGNGEAEKSNTKVASSQFPVVSSSLPSALQTSDSEARTPNRGLSSGERRQLTVMFCDLVGSTALSEQLDPEELREVVRAYQQVSAEVISRFEGHIAQYLGDGLLVYFGYPLAHEDDAQRAVRAGLGIVEAIREFPQRLNVRLPRPVQVRIGIHTGLVVVGEMGGGGKREQLALGETPNIAARLQGLAEPDTVVMSGATYRLSEGFFACRGLGPTTAKGISVPMDVYQVLEESGVQSRFEVATRTGLTPLVGREQEVGLLWERWERAKEGAGQVMLLSGEAGIGKSRLLQVLKKRVATEQHTRLECRCSPYHQNSALYPVIDLLQRVLQFQREESPEEKLCKLEKALESYGFALPEVVPLFATLLSLPLPERYSPLTLTPQKQKEKTQQAIVTWLLKEAECQALLSAWEDLHWADPSTLELLDLLITQVPTARMYLLLTFRPEFTPPWTSRSHLTPLTLSRLSHTQAEVMVTQVTGGKALPSEVLQQIVAKTDGVPLFVEELTKAVLEAGTDVGARLRPGFSAGHVPLSLTVPATLHDSLMARLDRLGSGKEVAQLGATLGREFSYELLQAVSAVDEETLQQELARLVDAEFLFQRGLPPQARYVFKHALIQDAAYQSLLKSTRQQYHQQIAQVLAEQFPETVETQPELLAYHYTEAGFIAQAIPYWQQAGQKAAERSANVEAISHLTKALELLKTFPDTLERAQQELALQLALGAPLIVTKGYTAPEVEQGYARALELCRQMGETPQLFPVLGGLQVFYLVRAEYQTARELAEQLLRLAQNVQDPVLLLQAHRALGVTLFSLGDLVSTREHLERGITLYNSQQYSSHAVRTFHAQDPGTVCLSYVAWVLWLLGYPDQALKKSYEALALARELSHPFSLALVSGWVAIVHQIRREEQAAQAQAEAAITLCVEQGFALYLAQGTITQGWALAEQGQGEEGIARIRQGLVAGRAKVGRTCWLALLAEACGKAGHAEEGRSTLAEALAMVDKTGERFYEAELYRLNGELRLAQSCVQSLGSSVKTNQKAKGKGQKAKIDTNPQSLTPNPQAEAEAEACFLKAIEIARKQQAKSLELRAVMSLARLWQRQGKQHEARNTLSEIYNWFTEGFDTKDLQEAKGLLDSLR